jgi:hypothetical protein
LTVEYIDPMRNLGRARELQARFEFGPEENLVVVESGGKTKQISAVDMAEYDFIPQLSGDPPRVVAFKGEQALTSALIELGEETQRTVYFLQGQGEPRVGGGSTLSLLQEYIARQGVRVAPLNLGVMGGVPEDAAGIVIVGSRYDLPPASAQLLGDYWAKDGRIMVLLDPAAETPLLREFLASAGITPLDDRVLRTVELGFVTGIVRDVVGTFSAVNRVTRRLQGAEALLPGATCSLVLDEKKEGTLVEPLITADEPFWGEKDHVTDENKGVAFDAGADTAAPLVVAAMAERGGVADRRSSAAGPACGISACRMARSHRASSSLPAGAEAAPCAQPAGAASTSSTSTHTSSKKWLRLSLHIVIWRCAWCRACNCHHQRTPCWPRCIQ